MAAEAHAAARSQRPGGAQRLVRAVADERHADRRFEVQPGQRLEQQPLVLAWSQRAETAEHRVAAAPPGAQRLQVDVGPAVGRRWCDAVGDDREVPRRHPDRLQVAGRGARRYHQAADPVHHADVVCRLLGGLGHPPPVHGLDDRHAAAGPCRRGPGDGRRHRGVGMDDVEGADAAARVDEPGHGQVRQRPPIEQRVHQVRGDGRAGQAVEMLGVVAVPRARRSARR